MLITALAAGCAFPGRLSPHRSEAGYTVVTHPDGQLYVGDQVSFEVVAPEGGETAGHRLEISFRGSTLGSNVFQPYGLGERSEAVFWWVWDTRGLEPGSYTVDFSSLPDGASWTDSISLRPASQIPAPEPEAHWTETRTVCCTIYTITGTDAARDIEALGQAADRQSAAVSAQMGAGLKEKLTLVFIPRVLGHGGFTLNGVYVSYLDGNYVSNDMDILLHHEFVHFYDVEIGGGYRPPILEEGLAVYLTGGHYKPEELAPRAAELVPLGWYIPLAKLADDFYNQQHEIGYLEAGALIGYLVDTYGWQPFDRFYRSIPPPNGKSNSQTIDAGLRASFGITFDDLEAGYRKYLSAQTLTKSQADDLQLTVRCFDTARHYQQAFDPSAYFLTAWLPDGVEMRQRAIVADLLRHPHGWENRYLEAELGQAWTEISAGEYASAGRTLNWLDGLLDFFAPLNK